VSGVLGPEPEQLLHLTFRYLNAGTSGI
jgi:hypothetical protein